MSTMTITPRRARTWLLMTVIGIAAACGPEGCCAPPPPTQIGDDTLRACDVLVTVDGDEVPAVEFDAAVRGTAIPEAPKLAVSFASRTDASLKGVVPFSFRFRGAPGVVTAVTQTCFDATGTVIVGATVVQP